MRLSRFLSRASLVAPFVLAASILTPTAHASGSPSADRALLYSKKGECVAFVADVMAREFGDLTFYWDGERGRNANTFVARAKKKGLPVDHTPSVPSVMYEPAGRYGHVAVVREVYDDGSFKVEESNYRRGRKTARVLTPSPRFQFIHPKAKETLLASNTGSDRVMLASAVLLADMSDPLSQEFVPVHQMEIIAPTPEALPVSLPVDTPSPQRDAKYVLPESAISSSDTSEGCRGPRSRFCKVPKYLVPIYEATAEKYDLPVKYLAADGSYESGFNPKEMSDHGTSCGLHSFRDTRRTWHNWGFKNLSDCLDPVSNIDKVGEYWRKLLNGGRGMFATIRKFNGAGSAAESYARNVTSWGDSMYQS